MRRPSSRQLNAVLAVALDALLRKGRPVAFAIITLDGEQIVPGSGGVPWIASQLFLADPNGGPSAAVSRDNPLPTQTYFGPSGVVPVGHIFNAPNEQNCIFAPLAGRPFNLNLIFSEDAAGCRMQLLRSFDQGATWNALTDDKGDPLADFGASASCHFLETESGIRYSLQMTARDAGSVDARLSQ